MHKIVFFAETGRCGMQGCSLEEYPDNVTDRQLSDDAYQFALNNAEMYGIYPTEYKDTDTEDEDGDEYSDNIEGWWEEYDPEKHDGKL